MILSLKNCRGQGYDNGANMAGIYNGAQAAIREKIPKRYFLHVVHIVLIYVEYMQ